MTTLIPVVTAVSVSACAGTPLLGPGPDMDGSPEDVVPLGGVPEGRAAVTTGLDDEGTSAVGSGDLEDLDDEDSLLDTNEPLEDAGVGVAGENGLLEDDNGIVGDDDGLADDGGLGVDDTEVGDDDGLLDDNDGLTEDDGLGGVDGVDIGDDSLLDDDGGLTED